MNSVASLITTVAVIFLVMVVPSIFAYRWSARSVPNRFWPAVILSLVTMVLALIALKGFQFTASRSVNGRLVWHFDSKWLFIAGFAVGVLTLVYTIYKKKRSAIVT